MYKVNYSLFLAIEKYLGCSQWNKNLAAANLIQGLFILT